MQLKSCNATTKTILFLLIGCHFSLANAGTISISGSNVTVAGGGTLISVGGAGLGPGPVLGGTITLAGPTINLTDFTASVEDNAQVLNSSSLMNSLSLNGAHHRPLLTYHSLNNKSCLWATGDVAHYGRGQDANGELVEVGGCYDFVPQRVRFGVGVGKSFLKQDLVFSGENHLNGEYVIAELDYQPLSLPFIFSLTGTYGRWDADVDRGYLNAGNVDQSNGDTDIESIAFRGRMDWIDAFSFAGTKFSPRVSYTQTYTETDAYTETGGSLPIRFNGRDQTTKELRYGIDVERQFGNKTWGRMSVEGVHRFDKDDPVLSGQVIDLFTFSLTGLDHEQDWARIGAEVEHLWSDNTSLSAGINGSSEGQDPTISGSISIKVAF